MKLACALMITYGGNEKTLMDHLREESGEKCKFGSLPEMCSNALYQLGALKSEIFSERMINVANILVDVHHIRLDQDNIDKIFFANE